MTKTAKNILLGLLYVFITLAFFYAFSYFLRFLMTHATRTFTIAPIHLAMISFTLVISVIFSVSYIKTTFQSIKKQGIKLNFPCLIVALLFLFFWLCFHLGDTMPNIDIINNFRVLYSSHFGQIMFHFIFWYNIIHMFKPKESTIT